MDDRWFGPPEEEILDPFPDAKLEDASEGKHGKEPQEHPAHTQIGHLWITDDPEEGEWDQEGEAFGDRENPHLLSGSSRPSLESRGAEPKEEIESKTSSQEVATKRHDEFEIHEKNSRRWVEK